MLIYDSVKKYAAYYNNKSQHPLIQVMDMGLSEPKPRSKFRLDFYAIFIKNTECGSHRYGNKYYDYEDGTMLFLGPGQVIQNEPEGEMYQPFGKAIVFHPDLLHKTTLGKQIDQFHFFSYHVHEALHLSDKERSMIELCFENIKTEIDQNIDKHSKQLIVTNLELMLKYCSRFYDRQFITREDANEGIMVNFEDILQSYLKSEKLQTGGIPTLTYFADKLNLSTNYFGDLVKKETGTTALEYIHLKLMDLAKGKLMDSTLSVSEVSYQLGFKYPQHFTRLFKQKVGMSPLDYRNLN
ncbi:helix-turn-helix domain-containing protein [Jiulongibacter sp. NS-SX5]|uniref:helix-turn-helix domain-containing protein n=1 Tax=Jiulongibacter sp. NS-SX5 TaxID=3463854 RepID=UPI00405987AB